MLTSVFFVIILSNFNRAISSFIKKSIIWKSLIYFIIGLNCLLLLISIFKPAKSTISLYRFLYQRPSSIDHIYSLSGNPFEMVYLPLNFYLKEKPTVTSIQETSLKNLSSNTWVLANRQFEAFSIIDNFPHCQIKFSNMPHWFSQSDYSNIKALRRIKYHTIFLCTAPRIKR